jgi:pimeloyl-ACP methyl ester carboxylesterase
MPVVRTPLLDIGYEAHGPADGPVAILLHGFPDDVRCWDGVAPPLAAAGMRVLAPWLRGYGPTRFRDPTTPRSGEQAALGADLLAFMDGMGIGRAVLAGYDWGGRAACVVSALWPDRVAGLVSATGYNIQHLASAAQPASPQAEARYWYQWYFHTERGRAGLAANRTAIAGQLWRMWSPNWDFDEATLARTAASFDNPDYVDVVIHSYRHRHKAAPGDPALAEIEAALAARPIITVPSINLHGLADGVGPPKSEDPDAAMFSGPYRRVLIERAGHFLPQEAPGQYVDAILELAGK